MTIAGEQTAGEPVEIAAERELDEIEASLTAIERAIEGFDDGTVHLILGGRNKDADLATLTPMVRRKARRAYLIGEAAEEFAVSLDGAIPVERSGTLDIAVGSAAAQARPLQ